MKCQALSNARVSLPLEKLSLSTMQVSTATSKNSFSPCNPIDSQPQRAVG
jgi:hypothetical protein